MLRLVRSVGGRRSSFFLRAESMHGLYTYLESLDPPGPALHEMSHGESFLELLGTYVSGDGFYVLDEPEAALSFRSCLGLLAALDDLRVKGAQVLCATHSPLLASLPGATILEVGEHGIRESTFDELDLVRDWRAFLDAPDRYLRHLLE